MIITTWRALGTVPEDRRWDATTASMSSSPVTAGLDFGLVMIAELRSRFYAECTQLVSEFAPQPRFNAVSMKTAGKGKSGHDRTAGRIHKASGGTGKRDDEAWIDEFSQDDNRECQGVNRR